MLQKIFHRHFTKSRVLMKLSTNIFFFWIFLSLKAMTIKFLSMLRTFLLHDLATRRKIFFSPHLKCSLLSAYDDFYRRFIQLLYFEQRVWNLRKNLRLEHFMMWIQLAVSAHAMPLWIGMKNFCNWLCVDLMQCSPQATGR